MHKTCKESSGASDNLFTSGDCVRGMNVVLCAGQTAGSDMCVKQKETERSAAQSQSLQMSGLHRQQAAVVRERQAALERLGGGQQAENKKEPLSQLGMSSWIHTQCIL